jgi:hypothetical protein
MKSGLAQGTAPRYNGFDQEPHSETLLGKSPETAFFGTFAAIFRIVISIGEICRGVLQEC